MDIGKGTRISLQAKLGKTYPRGVHIGNHTVIAYNSSIITHVFINQEHKDTFIGSNCFIGAGAVVMAGVKIGDNCIVSPNSVVMQNVPAGSIVVGNPAKIVQTNIITGPWGMRHSPAKVRPEAVNRAAS